MSSPSYLILGAGVFGVSTAYHLIQKYPKAHITIVDRDAYDADSRVAASWDWNKVVRADYDDYYYCRLALEAQDIFLSDPLFKPYFHETGIYWTCRDEGYAGKVIENFRKLGRKADLKALPVAEARKLYGGLFEEADYSNVKEVLVNKSSGWAAAGDCLRAVTREALRLGVKYVVADVETLKFEGDRCVGVKTMSGEAHIASHIILSSGAYTSKLLEYSAASSGNKALCAEGRIRAGGIATGMTRLNSSDYASFASMPVGVQGYTPAMGPFIGSLPPTPNREIKWWGQTIFQNPTEVLPGRVVSAPPNEPHYGQWNLSRRLRDDILHASQVFYGTKKNAHWKYEKHRICWDAFTTTGDFLITPHSAAKGLYVATCGNFHGWKFFPVIGKYVVQMLEGQLEEDLEQKWAWDPKTERPVADSEYLKEPLNPDYPRFELKTLMDPVRVAKL